MTYNCTGIYRKTCCIGDTTWNQSVSTFSIENSKRPFKCPLCEGKGKIKNEYVMGMLNEKLACHVCEGKGIVWG